MTNPVIIDISHWNPTPNWDELLETGTLGVIHKATEGTGYVDKELMKRARPALDAGLCWATYHFLRPGSMRAQMDHYLKAVNPKPGERMCLDHEDKGVSLTDLEEAVGYLNQLRPDLLLTIYSGHVIKEQLEGKRSQILSLYTDLWLAQYTTGTPSWPDSTWPKWRLWQYSDTNTAVAGFPPNTPIDSNKFDGGIDDIYDWFGPNSPVQLPPIEPIEPEIEPPYIPEEGVVRVSINVPAGVPVEIEVNGEVWDISTR